MNKILNIFLYPAHIIAATFLLMFCRSTKFGLIRSSRFGHFVGDSDIALTRLNNQKNKAKQTIVFCTENQVCNHYILKILKRVKIKNLKTYFIKSFIAKRFIEFLSHTGPFKGLYFQSIGLSEFYKETIRSKPIFYTTRTERAKLKKWLDQKNLEDLSKPFIYLHNRDSAFLPGANWAYHSYRDFSPLVFTSIIRKYHDRFNFFRGGKVANEPVPQELKGCLDLPFTPHSDLVDILAHQKSIFFFGSDSGVNCASAAFRKPIGGINYPACCYRSLRRINYYSLGFIPKKLWCIKTAKFIGLREMYERKIVNFWDAKQYDLAQIRVVEDSEEEVTEFFGEALYLYENNMDKTHIGTDEQEEFWRIVTFYEPDLGRKPLILDNCFIGNSFLKKNSYLTR